MRGTIVVNGMVYEPAGRFEGYGKKDVPKAYNASYKRWKDALRSLGLATESLLLSAKMLAKLPVDEGFDAAAKALEEAVEAFSETLGGKDLNRAAHAVSMATTDLNNEAGSQGDR